MDGIERGTGAGKTPDGDVEANEQALAREEIHKALEGKGELSDIPATVAKIVEQANERSRGFSPKISSEDLTSVLTSVREAHPEYAAALEQKAERRALEQVISRLYAIDMVGRMRTSATKRFELEVKKAQRQLQSAQTNEEKEEVRKNLETLKNDIEAEHKKFADMERKVRTASIETSVQDILDDAIPDTLGVKDAMGREAIKNTVRFARGAIDKMKNRGKPDAVGFLKTIQGKLPSFYPRRGESDQVKESRETAREVAKDLSIEIAELNEYGDRDIRKQPVYPKTHFRWWHPQEMAARSGIGRAGEWVTSYLETLGLVSAFSYGVATTLDLPPVSLSNNPVGWSALAVATGALLVRQSLAFKSDVEKEALRSKRTLSNKIPVWMFPLRAVASTLETTGIFLKTAAKHPVRASAAGISTWAVGTALTKAILISLQSQAVTEQGVAGHVDAVKQELSQLEDVDGLTPSMKLFDGLIDLSGFVPEGMFGSNQPKERQPGEGLTVTERVENQPDALLHRMQVAIKAEAGDPDAMREAKKWGIPLSGTAGLGPRAVALAQLIGLTLDEARALTGRDDGTIQETSAEVRAGREKIRTFAQSHGLSDYMIEEDMQDPQLVVRALSEQFSDSISDDISEFTSNYDLFFSTINDVTSATTATAFINTLGAGQPTPSPDDVKRAADQLKASARNIQTEYDEYSNKVSDLSRIMGESIKAVYVENNTAGAQFIDVNKIALTPEPLKLDFTNLDRMVADIETTMQEVGVDKRPDAIGDPKAEQTRFEEYMQDAGIRLDNLAEFLSPFNEIETIVALEAGEDLDPEIRDQRVFNKTMQILGMSLAIQFAMLLAVNIPATRRLQRVQEQWGEQNSELITNAEGQIVDFIHKRMNRLIHQAHATINRLEKKHKSVKFAFPYEPVAQSDVRRVLRAVGTEDYIKQNQIMQLLSKGPDIDLSINNRYSNWLFALGDHKNVQTIINELLPGWDDGRRHIEQLQRESGEKPEKRSGTRKAPRITGRWHNMDELTPEQDVRAYEIAVHSELKRRDELDISLHEAWLSKNKETRVGKLFKGFSGAGSGMRSAMRKGLARAGLEGRFGMRANADEVWTHTFKMAAENASVVNQMNGKLARLRDKAEARKKRIEELFKDLSRNHVLYKYEKAREKLAQAYKSEYLYKYDKPLWKKTMNAVAPFTRPAFEETVNAITKKFKKEQVSDDTRPFDALTGYFDDLVEKIAAQQDELTPEVIKERVDALLKAAEHTRVGFEKSLNATFGTGHSAEITISDTGEGAKMSIDVQGPLGRFEQEALLTPAIMGMSNDDNLERAAGAGLLGPVLWSKSRKNFTFNPKDKQMKTVRANKAFVDAYMTIWEQMEEAAKTQQAAQSQNEEATNA